MPVRLRNGEVINALIILNQRVLKLESDSIEILLWASYIAIIVI